MKLYTEEQIKFAMLSSYLTGVSRPPFYEEYEEAIFNSLTPIELPSDEEIERKSRSHCNIKQDLIIDHEERYYKDFQKYDSFIDGAKWMKEQILNQNK